MIKVIINQEGKNTRERPREIPVQNNAGNEHSNNLIIANITSQLKKSEGSNICGSSVVWRIYFD